MKEAAYYTKLGHQKVRCHLCPHNCVLNAGKTGICRIRTNIEGVLYADTYQQYSAVSFDPIEKKPLYHYFPGREVLSLGSLGCNMRCKWCQNCEISQVGINADINTKSYDIGAITDLALSRKNNVGVAFTYNEPSIAVETNLEIAHAMHQHNLKNVMVTNGYVNRDVLQDYLKLIDAYNLDIKSFVDDIHKKNTHAELSFILENAKAIFKAGKHLEITCLVVTGVNDTIEEFTSLVKWIKSELSGEVPLHISRYFPRNKFESPPTPESTMLGFAQIAKESLSYVYLGNMKHDKYQDTYCPGCRSLLIERFGYGTNNKGIDMDGGCEKCGQKIAVSG